MKDLEIIGEAASKVGVEIRQRETHVPWIDIVGMRNRLVHAYFDVAFEFVWDTVEQDLPILIRELVRIQEESGSSEEIRPKQ